jgi:hypothetical protein
MPVGKVMARQAAKASRKVFGQASHKAASTSFKRYAKTLSALGKDVAKFHPVAGKRVRRVAPNLLRGPAAQTEAAFKKLVTRHKIRTMITLLDPTNPKEIGLIKLERKMARKMGVDLQHVAMPFGIAPPKKSIARFLRLTTDKAKGQIYLHCRLGRDRTGTMVAVFREAVQKWSPSKALAEMKAFGYSPAREPYLSYLGKFVKRFGTYLR